MDYLAIAYVKKGNNAEAVKIYSKILTAKIEAKGFKQDDCMYTLTKLSLLQLKKNDKMGSSSCAKKIKTCLSICHPCEKERFEKLLKASKATSGLDVTAVIGLN
jgi:hypothetical protein